MKLYQYTAVILNASCSIVYWHKELPYVSLTFNIWQLNSQSDSWNLSYFGSNRHLPKTKGEVEQERGSLRKGTAGKPSRSCSEHISQRLGCNPPSVPCSIGSIRLTVKVRNWQSHIASHKPRSFTSPTELYFIKTVGCVVNLYTIKFFHHEH